MEDRECESFSVAAGIQGTANEKNQRSSLVTVVETALKNRVSMQEQNSNCRNTVY